MTSNPVQEIPELREVQQVYPALRLAGTTPPVEPTDVEDLKQQIEVLKDLTALAQTRERLADARVLKAKANESRWHAKFEQMRADRNRVTNRYNALRERFANLQAGFNFLQGIGPDPNEKEPVGVLRTIARLLW